MSKELSAAFDGLEDVTFKSVATNEYDNDLTLNFANGQRVQIYLHVEESGDCWLKAKALKSEPAEINNTEFTAVARDNLRSEPHYWTKGLDYQMVVNGDRIKLSSNEGETSYPIEQRLNLEILFDITEGWKP
jgi:hypothetical protein